MAGESDNINEFVITWTIEKFSCCVFRSEEKLYSPSFPIDMPGKTYWSLYIQPKGKSGSSFMSFYLEKKESGVDKMKLGMALEVLNSEGLVEITRQDYKLVSLKGISLGYKSYASLHDLYVEKREKVLHNDCLTLRARIWKTEGNLPDHIHCFARTLLHKEVVSFVWTIDNLSSLTKRSITAPRISDQSPEFNVCLSLHGDEFSCCGQNLGIEVSTWDRKNFKLLNVSFSLLNSENRKVETRNDEIYLHSIIGNTVWREPCFFPTKLLSRKGYLKNDSLRFDIEMVAFKGVVYEAIESYVSRPGSSRYCNYSSKRVICKEEPGDAGPSHCLSHDLQSMHLDNLMTDVTLQAGDESFPAHRALLSARSPVFRAMFESDMRESVEGTVRIDGIDPSTLQSLVRFLCSDSVGDLQEESAQKLYFAADEYQIPLLKQKCRDFFTNHLSFSNASDMLILADMHSDDSLKSSVLDFVVDKYNEVLDTDSWRSLMKSHSALAAEAMYQKFLTD